MDPTSWLLGSLTIYMLVGLAILVVSSWIDFEHGEIVALVWPLCIIVAVCLLAIFAADEFADRMGDDDDSFPL